MKTERFRWPKMTGCLVLSMLMLLCGWLVPAHLRAVDNSVLELAAYGKRSLVECGLQLVQENNVDSARLILEAAQSEKIPAGYLVAAASIKPPDQPLFSGGQTVSWSVPITTLLIKSKNREPLLAYLNAGGVPAVKELLRARELTNTVLFPAAASASGQAIDAAISLGGLLLAENHLAPGLRDALVQRVVSAETSPDAQPLEEILMDMMSLGQRLDLGQLIIFVQDVNEPKTFDILSEQVRKAGDRLPVLFASVAVSRKPDQIASYLEDFSQTGLEDLSTSLSGGQGGVNELLRRHERLYKRSPQPWESLTPVAWFVRITSISALRTPSFALMLKWFFYILGGFFLALAVRLGMALPVESGGTVTKQRFNGIRELLFELGFLLVILLLTEPFLAQDNQKEKFVFKVRLPAAGALDPTANATSVVKNKLMDTRSLITLALFFVLQGLIYSFCLAKLREIRRQKLPARVQLKLLENEEHLFDGGLYLGFAGTIICLILVSLGVIQQSLMAAYSSTSFGIIFVSIFKIFNLRPVRRRLLMDAEQQAVVPVQPMSAERPSMASP